MALTGPAGSQTEPHPAEEAGATPSPGTGAGGGTTPPNGGAAGLPPTPVGVPPAPRLRNRALLGSRRRQVVAASMVAAAIAFLVVEGLGNATEYYKTVPQAVADQASLGTRHFRIMGTVDNDVKQAGQTTTFSITYEKVTAQVVDSKEPPQLFKPGVPVVLDGYWSGTVFQSDLIMVKHTANYTPPTDPDVTTIPGPAR